MPRMRFRNSPPIKDLIIEMLKAKTSKTASLDEIYDYVLGSGKIKLAGKTPKNTIYSVIFRMPEVTKVKKGQYKITK